MGFEPKPIRIVVVNSSVQPGRLSLRLDDDPDLSGTALKDALSKAGLKPGDVVELRYVGERPGQ